MFYVLLSLILLIFLVEKLYKEYSTKNLFSERRFNKKYVEIGEEFEISLIVENRKLLPLTFVQINENYPDTISFLTKSKGKQLGSMLIKTIPMSIMPYQRKKRIYKAVCNIRGRLTVDNAAIEVGDFAGFGSYRKNFNLSNEIIVLPKPYDLKEKITAAGGYLGDISVKRWIIEDPVLISGIREYTGVEPQKTIHWASSLKQGRLMVKKFDYTSDYKAMVILNNETSKPFWAAIDKDKVEKCISTARTVVEDLNSIGIPYGFLSNTQLSADGDFSSYIQPGWGEAQLFKVLDSLGRMDYFVINSFEEMVENFLSRDFGVNTVIIITPNILESYSKYINMLLRNSSRVCVITFNGDRQSELSRDIKVFNVEG